MATAAEWATIKVHVAGNGEPGGYNFDANMRNAVENAQYI